MEQEKKEYKKLREREKERQREKEKEREREKLALERLAMERKWQEADYRVRFLSILKTCVFGAVFCGLKPSFLKVCLQLFPAKFRGSSPAQNTRRL